MANILRSSAFRIAIAFALAVTLITLSVFLFVYVKVSRADIAQVRNVLHDEALNAPEYPAAQLREEFHLRLTHDLRRVDYVGLFKADGTKTYGNVQGEIPVPIDGEAHVTTTETVAPEWPGPAVFVARRRSDGSILLLGRSLNEVYRLQDTMRSAFVATILPTVIIALAIGAFVSRRASLRLLTIRHAIQRVMQGELHARLPVRRSSDDINEVVAAVNLMLDEIVRLLAQIKSVGDNIAHDLKTPLALMRARLERGVAAQSLEVLHAAAGDAMVDLDRAMGTVTALLRISALESCTRRSAFEGVEIGALCREIYELFEPLAEAKHIDMSLEASAARIVQGDRGLLQEAVVNLVDNAIKFTPGGGSIVLQYNDGPVLIRVADSGPGVREGEKQEIFRRFYRSSAARDAPGVGLGLSMAATIVELHGFEIRVRDNAPGAVFEVISPPA
ncbi:HAMP domain-containing sensor histidine kinase [Beijerinckia sp. L45]|uniref:sensor histidine kinase n=1 Tax=Beijerinckia sp. L45 TaxID=1641855 RepID=UPI00131E91E8|nr:HAMP domain-containing sensor histidine kinase [Beijerinckia sp. L45]